MYPSIINTPEFKEGLLAFFEFCHPGNRGKAMDDIVTKLDRMRTVDEPIIMAFIRNPKDPELMRLQPHGDYSYNPIEILGSGGKFLGGTYRVSLLTAVHSKKWTIQSVLLNGIKYCLGDIVDGNVIVEFQLPMFNVRTVVTHIVLENSEGMRDKVDVKFLCHKQPKRFAFMDCLRKRIYTTEEYYSCNPRSNYSWNKTIARGNETFRDHLVYFKEKQDVMDYIANNRKLLSVADVKELRQTIPNKIGKGLEEALINLAKTRL